jgi:hypothetical protein
MNKKDVVIYKALEKIKEATVAAKPAKKPTFAKTIKKAPIVKASQGVQATVAAKPAKKPTFAKTIKKAPIVKASQGGHLKPVKK